MPGAELRREASYRQGSPFSTGIALAIEAVGAAIEVFLLPSVVLAFFVAELTPSYTTIGLVPAIATAFWTLGRVPAAIALSGRRRLQPWAFGAAATRAGAILILGVFVSRTNVASLGGTARPLLGAFFLCFIVYALASGFGSVAQEGVIRTTIKALAWEQFVTLRALWSAAASLLAAIIVTRVLASAGVVFPANYGRLFIIVAVILIAMAAALIPLREPVFPAAGTHEMLAARSMRSLLGNARWRRFTTFQLLFAASGAIDPFLFLYAVTRLGLAPASIGTFVIAGVLGWVVTAPLWHAMQQKYGPRAVLRSASVLRVVPPAVALVVPQIAATEQLAAWSAGRVSLGSLYAVAFVAIGCALAGQSRAANAYARTALPAPIARAGSETINMLLIGAAFAPVAGGAMIQRYGYETLFVAVAVVALAAVLLSGTMADSPAMTTNRTREIEPQLGILAVSSARG
ncbi:MAG: hypothetical protein U0031_14675 [Thermomicrobiales bacterium]